MGDSAAGPLPSYSTWIRRRRIVIFWLLAGVCAAAIALTAFSVFFALFGVPALIFAYIAFVITLTARRFSENGGGYQRKVHELIATSIPGDGRLLDVGCGSGALLIRIARASPERPCVGVDTWGDDWEYSAEQCRRNAEAEGVANATFERASAARLGYDDAAFANVVSCLTFHEVRDVPDRTQAIREALRVLEHGGRFAFFDLFHDPEHFGSVDRVTEAIVDAGGEIDRFELLSSLMRLPYPLGTPRVLKYAALVTGRKA